MILYIYIYKVLRSTGGFGPQRLLKEIKEQTVKQTEVRDFRCKLTTRKCQELPVHARENHPDVACVYICIRRINNTKERR